MTPGIASDPAQGTQGPIYEREVGPRRLQPAAFWRGVEKVQERMQERMKDECGGGGGKQGPFTHCTAC